MTSDIERLRELARRLREWANFAEGRVGATAGPFTLEGDLRSGARHLEEALDLLAERERQEARVRELEEELTASQGRTDPRSTGVGGEVTPDAVFADDGGLWVRDPLGNCRPFDINDYESLADEAKAVAAMLDRYDAPTTDDADGAPLSLADRVEAMVYLHAVRPDPHRAAAQPPEPAWAKGGDWQSERAAQALDYAHARLRAGYDPAMTTLERELCRAVCRFALQLDASGSPSAEGRARTETLDEPLPPAPAEGR